MSHRASTALALALGAISVLAAAEPPKPMAPSAPAAASAAAGFHRLELPAPSGQSFPYTVEVPADWQVLGLKDAPGVWLGPSGAKPPDDPRLVYVRISPVPLANPEAIVAAIKENDAKDDTWSASVVEVREVGGVKGVFVQVDDKERSTLTLKMPLAKTSVDFIGSARREDFARLRPSYERVLLSVRRAPAMSGAVTAAPPAKPGGAR
jgi:hypothetical protein